MKKKDNSVFIASMITLGLFLTVIFIFIKTNSTPSDKEKSILKPTEEKIDDVDFDITLITPKKTFESIYKPEFLIVDTRSKEEFYENHIENSINVPLAKIIEDAPVFLNKNQTIVFVENQETLEGKKIASQLKEKGYLVNYLKDGLYNYLNAGYTVISYGDPNSAQDRAKVNLMDLTNLGQRLQNGERFVYLDVRNNSDFNKDHFENATNIPLENLEKNKENIPLGKILVIDENPTRSFQAAVRLYDMNFFTVYCLTNSYSQFKKAVVDKTLLP